MGRLQIMFMSMGEPMQNYSQLEIALQMLYDLYPKAALLISTSAPRAKSAFNKLNFLSQRIPTIGLQF
jgi:23S rRNA (adenine2503-C2)-methyltransferase